MNQIKRQMIWIGLMAIVFVGLAANAAIQNTGPAYGQETGTATTTPTATVPSFTGDLVVAPNSLQVGQTAEAVGFHVEPVDLEVRIEYSEHFSPDGESCDGSSTTTPSAVAPTWIMLKACSAGNGYVRLVASDTGHVIEEVNVNVTVTAPPAFRGQGGGGGAARASVWLTGVASTLKVGSSDSFRVHASGLNSNSNNIYRLYTVPLNGRSLGFDRACTDFSETRTIRRVSSYSTPDTVYGCKSPGTNLWSYLQLNGRSIASSSIRANYVTVTTPPSIDISGLVSSMEEGDSDSFTVSASDLDSSSRYTIRVTTSDSDIGFNSRCSDRQEDVTVPSRRTSYSSSFTLHGCETSGGKVTATLRSGNTDVDSDSQDVEVTAEPAPAANSAPSFSKSSYSFSVRENVTSGTTVGSVSATDADRDTVSYSIVGGNAAGRFKIHSSNGRITTAKTLDHEVSADYELTVKAADASKFDLTTVTISVSNVNEAVAFDLDSYQFALPPPTTSTSDVLVGAVRAYDPDTDDIVSYTIKSGNVVSSGSNTFRIDGVGRIWAKRSGLPRTARDYALTIEASDGNGNTDTTSVKVKLTTKPIVTLRLDHDRLAEGDSITASVSISKAPTSNTAVTLDFGRPTLIIGQSPAAAITTPTATVQYGSFPRSIVFARGQSKTKVLTIETSGSDGTGLPGVRAGLTTSSSSVVIDNGVIPLVVHDTNIAIGESRKGEWGAIRYKKAATKPNERRYSLTVPSDKDNSLIQIDLTSGDRDSGLMLLDSDGDLVEGNDDSGPGSNARIVHRLASGTYTIVAHTQWPGGGGEYELSVSESTEDLTDPDGEAAASASELRRPSVSLDHLDITGVAWKNSDCTTSITSDDVTSAAQGDIVCIEVTGRDFNEDDAAMALLYARSDDEAWSLPIAGVGLKYINSTTMRGKWMAQWLSKQAGSTTGPTEYHLVIQHDERFIAEDTLRVTPPSSEASLSYSDAKSKLSTLGFNADSLLDTFWTIYGEESGYSDVSGFAVDFVQGATLGEWGVNSNPNRGLAYFAGWMVLGFLPGVDIVADARDFFYLEVLNCSDFWGCGTAFAWDAVDLFSVVPGFGKAGDVLQIGKAAGKAGKSTKVSDAGVDLVESVPDVLKSFLEGERRYSTLWSDNAITQFKRGRIIESGLFRQLVQTDTELRHLDTYPGLGSFPAIDFLNPRTGMAISVKSIYTSATRYKSIATFRKTLDRYASQVRSFELDQLPESRKISLKREIEGVPKAIESRRLDIVIPDGVERNSAHGRELSNFVCTQRRMGLEVIVRYTKPDGDSPFARWPESCGSS